MARKPLCIINMGGSTGMHYNEKKHKLEDGEIIANLLSYIPELQRDFQLDILHVYTQSSWDIATEHWIELCELIAENEHKYEGFVVIHGTSTMAYTASYVSFALQNLSKPVIFTGSIIPLMEVGSEARQNIINSCLVASSDIAEVAIVYGTMILRANRSTKAIENYATVFHSPNLSPLGEIKRPFVLNDHRKKRRKRVLQAEPVAIEDIVSITVTPGLQASSIEALQSKNLKALILQGYGAGCFPTRLAKAVGALQNQGVPIIITSQMHHNIATPVTFGAHEDTDEDAFIFTYDMTLEAATTKLMWLLGKGYTGERLKKNMEKNIAGETTEDLLNTSMFKKY